MRWFRHLFHSWTPGQFRHFAVRVCPCPRMCVWENRQWVETYPDFDKLLHMAVADTLDGPEPVPRKQWGRGV